MRRSTWLSVRGHPGQKHGGAARGTPLHHPRGGAENGRQLGHRAGLRGGADQPAVAEVPRPQGGTQAYPHALSQGRRHAGLRHRLRLSGETDGAAVRPGGLAGGGVAADGRHGQRGGAGRRDAVEVQQDPATGAPADRRGGGRGARPHGAGLRLPQSAQAQRASHTRASPLPRGLPARQHRTAPRPHRGARPSLHEDPRPPGHRQIAGRRQPPAEPGLPRPIHPSSAPAKAGATSAPNTAPHSASPPRPNTPHCPTSSSPATASSFTPTASPRPKIPPAPSSANDAFSTRSNPPPTPRRPPSTPSSPPLAPLPPPRPRPTTSPSSPSPMMGSGVVGVSPPLFLAFQPFPGRSAS